MADTLSNFILFFIFHSQLPTQANKRGRGGVSGAWKLPASFNKPVGAVARVWRASECRQGRAIYVARVISNAQGVQMDERREKHTDGSIPDFAFLQHICSERWDGTDSDHMKSTHAAEEMLNC